MAQILPFCGWRYDLSQIGALADVLAPALPPTTITPEIHRELSRRHPCNAIRLVDNQPEPGDPDPLECKRRAGGFFRLWRREGILIREHDDAFYVVQLLQSRSGLEYERWSLIGLLRPEMTAAGNLSPACPAQATEEQIQHALHLRLLAEGDFTPVQAVAVSQHPSTDDSLTDLLQQLVRQATPVECWSDAGDRWRIWPLTSSSALSRIHQQLTHSSLLVIAGADQLHATLRQQQLLAQSGQSRGPRDPAVSTLICITGADDPGLPGEPAVFQFSAAYPQGGPELRARAAQILGLVCRFSGNENNACSDALELAAINDEQPCIAAGTPDGEWHLVAAPARCRTTSELAELLQQTLAENPSPPTCVAADASADILQVPPSLILAVPSPWTSPVPGMGRTGAILPVHADLQPALPAGLVFSAHTNVAGRSSLGS
ncbi:MAG: DUF1015 family protein [Planctomycetaceae bacterium]